MTTSGVLLLRNGDEARMDYASTIVELKAVRGTGGEPVDRIVLSGDEPRMLKFPLPLHGMGAGGAFVTLISLDRPGDPADRAKLDADGLDAVVYSILSSELAPGRYSLQVVTSTGFLLASYRFRLIKQQH